MILFRLSKGDWVTMASPQPPVSARVDSISGDLGQTVTGGDGGDRRRRMHLTTVHSWAFFRLFRPFCGTLEITPPKRPGPTLAWAVFVDSATFAVHEKDTRMVSTAYPPINQRHLLLSLTPHSTGIVTPEMSIAELEAHCQSSDLGLIHPGKTRGTGTAITATSAGKLQTGRIPWSRRGGHGANTPAPAAGLVT